MEDPPRESPPGTDQAMSPDLDPKLLQVAGAFATSFDSLAKGALKALEGVDLRALVEKFDAQESAIERALPSREDYWVDLQTFSTMALPCGLGYTPNEFWRTTGREWLARWRVWKFHHPELPTSELAGDSARLAAISTASAQPQPATLLNFKAQSRKRGPQTDYKTAAKVAKIVARVAPDGVWRSKLDDILMALDDENIQTPKGWVSKHEYRSWYAAVAADTAARGRHLAVEAIKHHLKRAKEMPMETIP